MAELRRKAFTRTKTGCLTCRERRKKCDELKPACTGCTRNFIHCRWPVALRVQRVSTRSRSQPTLSSGSVCGNEDEPVSVLPLSPISSSSSETPNATFFDEYPLSSGYGPSPDNIVVDLESDGEDEKSEAMIKWQPALSSFKSAEQAIALNPSSLLLLQHYLEATSTFLVAKPVFKNPFVTVVLPLAFSDDLLMHSVLALSGTHLSFKKDGDLNIQLATRQHYSLLLRKLRAILAADSGHDDIRRTLRLLLVLIVLCHIEGISGEPHGGMFPHLRASRELVLKILQEPQEMLHGDIKLIQGFALEVYFWLVLVNSITPYCRDESRTIPFDSFFDSLEFLKEYDTFGIFLSCVQGLFEMIPQVSILAMRKLAEEESCVSSAETVAAFVALDETLMQWRSPPVASDMVEWNTEHVATGEIYRQALLIFIKASMCGSLINSPKVIVAIQRHIDVAMPLLGPVSESPFGTLLLWPIMIIGSCLICEHQRRYLIRRLHSEKRVDVRQVREAANLLGCLWEDEDDRSYGPFGLYLVMRKRQINFSIC